MNIFSILDDSDNEESVAKSSKPVKEAKPAPAPKKDIPGAPPKASKGKDASKDKAKDKAPKDKAAPAAAADPSEAPKESRAKNHRTRHGDKRGPKPDDGKREFDRRSGTGRGREVSRGGRGPYGAGNDKQDALEAEKDPSKAEVKAEDAGTTDVEEPAAEPEPEDNTITLDQFMEKRAAERQQAKAVFADDVKARAADKELLATLSKGGKVELESEGTLKEYGKKDQRSTVKSKILDVGFKFKNPEENSYEDRRPPRGEGRGSGRFRADRNSRGGRGGSSGRGGGSSGPTTVFNAQDFPTL